MTYVFGPKMKQYFSKSTKNRIMSNILLLVIGSCYMDLFLQVLIVITQSSAYTVILLAPT